MNALHHRIQSRRYSGIKNYLQSRYNASDKTRLSLYVALIEKAADVSIRYSDLYNERS
jgi:hypothetical protein